MNTPQDYEITRDYWEKKGLGACGPCSIAVAVGSNVQKIITGWDGGYDGFANVKDMEREFKKLGWKTKRVGASKSKQFIMPEGYTQALAFIQWGEYEHWIEAQKHTHWVYIALRSWKSSNIELLVFCNGIGWFSASSQAARDYLKDGHVRSYLAIDPPRPK